MLKSMIATNAKCTNEHQKAVTRITYYLQERQLMISNVTKLEVSTDKKK